MFTNTKQPEMIRIDVTMAIIAVACGLDGKVNRPVQLPVEMGGLQVVAL